MTEPNNSNIRDVLAEGKIYIPANQLLEGEKLLAQFWDKPFITFAQITQKKDEVELEISVLTPKGLADLVISSSRLYHTFVLFSSISSVQLEQLKDSTRILVGVGSLVGGIHYNATDSKKRLELIRYYKAILERLNSSDQGNQ